MKNICISKVSKNKNLGKYINIPKEKEDLFEIGDYVKLNKLDLEDEE